MMLRTLALLTLLLALATALFAPPVSAQVDSRAPAFSDILVRFQPGATAEQINRLLATRGLTAVRSNTELQVVLARPSGSVDLGAALASLAADPGVRLAEPNYRISPADAAPLLPRFLPGMGASVSDPLFSQQWGLQRIQAPRVWPLLQGKQVTIAIIDTGVDLTHPDLRARIVRGRNWTSPGSPPQDTFGHGTHVAGIAAAIQNNRVGVAGTATNVSIMPLKVLDPVGTEEDVASAIRYAARNNARVINLSLGTFTGDNRCPLVMQEAIDAAFLRGTVVVAAAGNYSVGTPFFPAACNHVIAVASSDYGDGLSWFSDFGDWVDISAPGEDILSTVPGGGYMYSTGTSMATPFVTGVAAMILGRSPNAAPDQVKRVIVNKADPSRALWGGGSGRLNAWQAVSGR